MELNGRRILITGGASGLGAAVAAMARDANAEVVILDRSLGQDVLSEQDVLAAIGPGIDVAVNCAGVATAKRTVGKDGPMALADFENVIRVNLIGTFNVVRLATVAMMKNEPSADGERGVIVNTASIAAFDGQIGQAAYAASKAAVAGMTLPLAREFARSGIRVMTIAPGLMDTPMLSGLPPRVKQDLGATVPFPGRLGSADEFARLVKQIIENSYLNGETIRLDGAIRMPPS